MSSNLANTIEQIAKTELGFALVGVLPVAAANTFPNYVTWLEHGFHGTMDWMHADGRQAKRADVRAVMPTAKTVVTLAYSYYTADLPLAVMTDPSRGIFARYAWGRDYHRVLKGKLAWLIKRLEQNLGHSIQAKAYVDTGPILERDLAQRAGLGWFGKNSVLINAKYGSYLFLCEILLDIECEPLQQKAVGGCRSCQKCVSSCPTKAIVKPGVIDARRCISYLTIEHKGSIPVELRPLMTNRIYGCDICQEVCPWNASSKAKFLTTDWLQAELYRQAPPLIELAQLTEQQFHQRFDGTPVTRTKRTGLLRNVAVALGNWGSAEAVNTLEMLAQDSDPIIREHAKWGIKHHPPTPSCPAPP